MTKDKAEKQGSETPSYLLEPITLEEGLVIPPPTRPMGPRRLARYYEEVADYLRAQQRGDEELPEPPLFMGVLEGQGQPATSSLAALSQLGSIEQGQAEDVELALSADTRTLLEDPLDHVTSQVLGTGHQAAEPAGPTADLATATDLESTATGFIDLAELAAAQEPVAEEEPAESDEADQEEPLEEEQETEPTADETVPEEEETASEDDELEEATLQDQVAAIIARAQLEEEPEDSAPDQEQESEDEELPGQMRADLPQPIAATSAQGLDFSDLDAAIAPRLPEQKEEAPAQEDLPAADAELALSSLAVEPAEAEEPSPSQDVLVQEPEREEEEEKDPSSNRPLLLALCAGILLLGLILLYLMLFA